jgi:hypothetical protein
MVDIIFRITGEGPEYYDSGAVVYRLYPLFCLINPEDETPGFTH